MKQTGTLLLIISTNMALMGGIVSLEKELINHINNSTGKVYWKQMQVFINAPFLNVGTTKRFG